VKSDQGLAGKTRTTLTVTIAGTLRLRNLSGCNRTWKGHAMGVFGDLANFAKHVVQGDLKGAVGDIGHGVQDVVGGAAGIIPGIGIASGIVNAVPGIAGGLVNIPGAVAGGIGGALTHIPGVVQGGGAAPANPCGGVPPYHPPAQGGTTVVTQQCCDRFTFNNGFLVDGATGTVWQFDPKAKAFLEVPVNHNSGKQSLIDSMIETKLSALRSQYESETLATVAPAQRAKQLAAFEKEHLTPLRIAAKALRY